MSGTISSTSTQKLRVVLSSCSSYARNIRSSENKQAGLVSKETQKNLHSLGLSLFSWCMHMKGRYVIPHSMLSPFQCSLSFPLFRQTSCFFCLNSKASPVPSTCLFPEIIENSNWSQGRDIMLSVWHDIHNRVIKIWKWSVWVKFIEGRVQELVSTF